MLCRVGKWTLQSLHQPGPRSGRKVTAASVLATLMATSAAKWPQTVPRDGYILSSALLCSRGQLQVGRMTIFRLIVNGGKQLRLIKATSNHVSCSDSLLGQR
jgi:hypothetical protein